MQNNTEKKQSIGAWRKQTSKGEVINFTINGQKYSMWPNSRKTTEKHPDFNIVPDNYKPQGTAYDKMNTNAAPKQTFTDNTGDTLPF